MVQAEHAGDLARAAAQNHDKKAREDHHDGVELGHPGDHDRCEAASADDGGGQRVVRTGGEQQADEAADRAGEDHRAHDDALDLDARIARGALALTDNGDLIAVLAVIEIDVHNAREDRHKQDREEIALAAENGEPAGLGILVDDTDLARALGHFPHDDEERGELCRDVVHHEREERFVRVPLGLEEGGDEGPQAAGEEAPQRACRDGGDDHNDDEKTVGDLAAKADHAGRGGKAADEHLTLGTDVPETHLERGRDRERDAEQDREVMERDPALARRTERAVEDRGVDLDGIFARQQRCDDRADDQSEHDRAAADQNGLVPGERIALGDVEERLFLIHPCCLPSRASSVRRPRACRSFWCRPRRRPDRRRERRCGHTAQAARRAPAPARL